MSSTGPTKGPASGDSQGETLRYSADAGAPPEIAAAPASSRFGKFVCSAKLGAGGMGEVWQAWDGELNRWVALKFLKGDDAGEIERFKREAQTAGRLSHPNIAAIHEVGGHAGRHWIAMQYVPGRTLKSFPREDRRLLVRLVRDAARAIAFAHAEGVIHRDVKPENLMVVSRTKPSTGRFDKGRAGSEHQLFVMDFGLARPMQSTGDRSATGVVVGTPAYMSPEQAFGEEVDGRTDVWSLGATLYELVTDRRPFRGADVMSMMKSVREEPPAPMTGVDCDLQAVVLKCLKKDRTSRYATAGDLAEDLERWLAGEPVRARAVSLVERVSRAARRNRGLTAAIVATLLVAIGGGAALIVEKRRAAEALERKEKEKRADEAALRKLAALWMEVIQKKQDLRALRVPPEKATAALEGAVAALDGMVAESPASAPARYARARARLYLGRFEEALSDVGETLRLAPGSGAARRLRGIILIALAQQVPVVAPDQRAALERRRAELTERAAVEFREAPQPDPDPADPGGAASTEDEIMRMLARALRLTHAERDDRAAVAILKAALEERHAEEYALQLAILGHPEWYDRAIAWAPGYALARLARGNYRSIFGDHRGAIDDFTELMRLEPGSVTAYLGRAYARWQILDRAGTLADLDVAVKVDPSNPFPVGMRGDLKREMRDFEGALRDLGKAIELDPKMARAWGIRAMTHIEKGDPAAAVGDADEALRLDASCDIACLARGLLRQGRGDARGALEDFDAAIRLTPRFVQARLARGAARFSQRQLDGAEEDFSAAIAADPGSSGAHNWLGIVKTEKGELDAALREYGESIRLDPRAAPAYYNRANVHARRGEQSLAMRDFDASIAADPGYYFAWAERGRLRLSKGDAAGAVRDLEETLRLSPPGWPPRKAVEQDLEVARAKARN